MTPTRRRRTSVDRREGQPRPPALPAATPHPFSREGLEARINRLAAAETSDERSELLRKLRDRLPAEGYRFALHTVVQAHALFASPTAKAQQRAEQQRVAHWRAQGKRLRAAIEKLAKHPLVRYLAYDLYEPDERCPHGRQRRECERLYAEAERLALLDRPPLSRYIKGHLGRLRRARAALPALSSGGFCEPRVLPPPPVPPPKKGRPRAQLEHFVVQNATGPLREAGLSLAESSDYVSRLLFLCLDIDVDAEAVAKRWQRLHARTYQPA